MHNQSLVVHWAILYLSKTLAACPMPLESYFVANAALEHGQVRKIELYRNLGREPWSSGYGRRLVFKR